MKLDDIYICDRCGLQNEENFKFKIEGTFGARHLCDKCKELFKTYFESFFTLHNTIKKRGFKQLKTTNK